MMKKISRLTGIVIVLLAFSSIPVSAHTGSEGTDWWQQWNFPALVGLALAGWVYARGVHRIWQQAGRGKGIRRWQVWTFAAALLVIFAALVSPLEALADRFFSVHMGQHILLGLLAPVLLVLSGPHLAFNQALPVKWRLAVVRLPQRWPFLRHMWETLSRPWAAWSLYLGILWIWHAPPFFQAAILNEPLHYFQHASFLASGLLFWWVVLHLPAREKAGEAFFLIFTTALLNGFLGVLILFSQEPWYPIIAEGLGAGDLTAMEDQQLAGVLMWIPPSIVYLSAALVIFRGWILGDNKKTGLLSVIGLVSLFILAGCSGDAQPVSGSIGDPDRGKELIQSYGCQACHTIPGVPGADSLTGPPLTAWSERQYIAGAIPNTPENLVLWIMDTQQIEPGTVMPNVGASESDAQDIAAYLFTLERNWFLNFGGNGQ